MDMRHSDFIALQPLALVDHVSTVDEALLSSVLQNGGVCARGTDASEVGGSKRVSLEEIQRFLGIKVSESVFTSPFTTGQPLRMSLRDCLCSGGG